jgi:predicted O-methyltransferase YrrM
MGMASMSMAVKYPNWFAQAAQYNFEEYLKEYAGKENLRFLQLGAFTGDASLWLLENILTGQGSRLTDVDTWEGSDEEDHESMDFADVFNVYKDKVKNFPVTSIESRTDNFLIRARAVHVTKYDFIYIDADHTTVGVLLDAELSWPLLMSGGIMAFDDYEWGSHLPLHLRAKPGIDLFLLHHKDEYETLVVNNQYWIKKL